MTIEEIKARIEQIDEELAVCDNALRSPLEWGLGLVPRARENYPPALRNERRMLVALVDIQLPVVIKDAIADSERTYHFIAGGDVAAKVRAFVLGKSNTPSRERGSALE